MLVRMVCKSNQMKKNTVQNNCHIIETPYEQRILMNNANADFPVGCKQGIKPYIININEPIIAYHHGFLVALPSLSVIPRTATQTIQPPKISAAPASRNTAMD